MGVSNNFQDMPLMHLDPVISGNIANNSSLLFEKRSGQTKPINFENRTDTGPYPWSKFGQLLSCANGGPGQLHIFDLPFWSEEQLWIDSWAP
jgi:hypothetical protein